MAPFIAKKSRADGATSYPGPYFIMVNAGGGWDPTYLCDPKGGAGPTSDGKPDMDQKSVNRLYTPDEIAYSGNIPVSPRGWTLKYGKDNASSVEVYSPQRFFDAHGSRVLAINGLDTTTNNHDSGSRTVWSGQQGEGFPSFAALVAGVKTVGAPVPMAFMSSGGYDATDGVVALTRAGSISTLQRIAYPDITDPNYDTSKPAPYYMSPDTTSRISAAQAARLQAMMGASSLPQIKRAQNSLFMARNSNTGLDLLSAALKSQPTVQVKDFPDLAPVENSLGDLQGLMQQAQIALLAFSAGVAVSANLNIGGYDTHSNHDDNQIPQLMKVLRGIDYVYTAAEALGLSDNLYVIVGSDFGRTPYYNMGNGKDHWNITSMLASGPGIQGNRVYGASTPYGDPNGAFKQLKINPDGTPTGTDSGIALQTQHVHRALRKLVGIDGSDVLNPYHLPGDDVPIFG